MSLPLLHSTPAHKGKRSRGDGFGDPFARRKPIAQVVGTRFNEGVGIPKNREMKEEPTMLLIIKGRFWGTHDVYENKTVNDLVPRY